ncbi:MAG: ABC transporter ATP-binding protein [Lactimicrobium sp.]|jgi:ATP-binding cassette subfamily B multidrug efflux pump|uniref:ABC transporter ATP-binding protein n=1 Tax=Lactimicrobium sp. TaxID=2563780 RepID=UPI002F3530A4
MSNLRKYLVRYKKASILTPLFKLLEALLDLFVPLVVAAMINRGITGNDTGFLVRCFILLLVLASVGLGFSITAQYFAAKASVGFATDLRQAVFDHIEQLSYSDLDKQGSDTLITRLTADINQVQTGFNLALRLLLRSPFIVFGAMIMAFTINVKCAIIFAVVIPLLALVVFGIMYASMPLFAKAQKALDKVLSLVRENLLGVRVIRAFCREKEEVQAFDEANEHLTKLNEKAGNLSAMMNPATYILINLATVVLLQSGAIQVNLGSLAQGDVVALYNYMAQIVVELIKLANLIISINKALACAHRVEDVLAIQPGMQYPDTEVVPSDPDTVLAFDHVSFVYEGGGADALSDVSFVLKKGGTLGVIGGTGAGKSTLVNLAARFYDVTKGKIKVEGEDVRDYPQAQLEKMIGVVPQKAELFAGSIRDNLKLGNEDADDTLLWQALDIAQAKDVVMGKSGELDSVIEQNGRNLSGGQKQRLTIARALVKQPQLLILDDSASALDYATDARLRQALRKVKATTLIISQRISAVRQADTILVLDQGRPVGLGTHEQLMKECPVYQEIEASQNRKEAAA